MCIYLFIRSSKSRSRELFLLGVVSTCLVMGLFTDLMGLSLEMGAFMAGLTLTNFKHRENALRSVEPLTGIFGGMFYAALGLILNPRFLIKEIITIIVMSLQIMMIKVLCLLYAIVRGLFVSVCLLHE